MQYSSKRISFYTMQFKKGNTGFQPTQEKRKKIYMQYCIRKNIRLDIQPASFQEILLHFVPVLPENSDDPCQVRELIASYCKDGWYCVIESGLPLCR